MGAVAIAPSPVKVPSLNPVGVSGANDPFFLVLHEHFDSRWVARVNGRSIEPVLTAGVSNGYPIEAVGEAVITIEYGGQGLFDARIVLSSISGLLAVLYLLVDRPGRLTTAAWTASRTTIGGGGKRRSQAGWFRGGLGRTEPH